MLDCLSPEAALAQAAAITSRPLIITGIELRAHPIVFANDAFLALTGYSREEVIGRDCRFLQGRETDPATIVDIREALAAGRAYRGAILNYRRTGEPFWNEIVLDPIPGPEGGLIGYVGSQNDISEARRAEIERADAERRLLSIAAHAPGYVYRRRLTADGTLSFPYLGPSLNRLLGIPESQTLETDAFLSFVHPEDREAVIRSIERSAARLSVYREEFRLVRADGGIVWVRSDAPPRLESDGAVHWDGIAVDITSEKSSQIDLSFLALNDPLTGLCNRRRFGQLVNQSAASLAPGAQLAVLCLDAQGVGDINAGLGAEAGDMALQAVAARLSSFAAARGFSVARLASDDFALLAPLVSDETEALAIAAEAVELFAAPLAIAGENMVLSVQVGLTLYPAAADADLKEPFGEILRRAGVALTVARTDGPGAYRLYAGEGDTARDRVVIRQSLHAAIEGGQFELHFQPQVDMAQGTIVGAEALVRWRHPIWGLQRPDLFIPLAEETGLIVPLGDWIIAEAIRLRRDWADRGLAPPRISVNISSVQLNQTNYLARVEKTLKTWAGSASDFTLELTESLLLEPSARILTDLETLRAMGFSISIDDFGAGHAGLKYLRDFPVDTVKIDQAFVRNLSSPSSDAAIVRSMIGLARSLGLEIMAEGVETQAQKDFLLAEGCRLGQGYLFDRPLDPEAFARRLGAGTVVPALNPTPVHEGRRPHSGILGAPKARWPRAR